MLAEAKGWHCYNKAVGGQSSQDFVDLGIPIERKGKDGQKVFLAWNINDVEQGVTVNQFGINLHAIIDKHIDDYGWLNTDFIGIAGYYLEDNAGFDQADYLPFIDKAEEVYNSYGILNFNLFNEPHELTADKVHETTLGHSRIFDFLNANI